MKCARLPLAKEGLSFKGHLKMRSAVGALFARAAVIEVEMTKRTLESRLPGRAEESQRERRQLPSRGVVMQGGPNVLTLMCN